MILAQNPQKSDFDCFFGLRSENQFFLVPKVLKADQEGLQKLLEFEKEKNLRFSCFEVGQGAWFSLRKIRNKQTNHSVLLHRCNPLSSSTGKNF